MLFDFLVVGPPRTAATWLHRNLNFRPQVYISAPKELIFFDRLDKPGGAHFRSNRLDRYSNFSISATQQATESRRNRQNANGLGNVVAYWRGGHGPQSIG